MDANKTSKLKEIGYQIRPACSLCSFSCFPNNDWGTCDMFTYDHLKHDGTHHVSIHKTGSCPEFRPSREELDQLAHFINYFKSE